MDSSCGTQRIRKSSDRRLHSAINIGGEGEYLALMLSFSLALLPAWHDVSSSAVSHPPHHDGLELLKP
jgi:hypothetical protein